MNHFSSTHTHVLFKQQIIFPLLLSLAENGTRHCYDISPDGETGQASLYIATYSYRFRYIQTYVYIDSGEPDI